jgi:hypothetical protein
VRNQYNFGYGLIDLKKKKYLNLILVFLIVGGLILALSGQKLFQVTQGTCKVARPYFGSINCELSDNYESEYVTNGGTITTRSPNTQVYGMTADFTCPAIGYASKRWKVIDVTTNSVLFECNDGTKYCGKTPPVVPEVIPQGHTIRFIAECYSILGSKPPDTNPQLQIRYRPAMLKLYMDSGNGFIPNTKWCTFNEIWDKDYSVAGKYMDSLKEETPTSKPNILSVLGFQTPPGNLLTSQPNQLSVGQSYWIAYDWVERPDLIVNDWNGKKVYCNPINLQLYEFGQVNTYSGACYLVPSSSIKSVECCESDTCKAKYGNDYFCDKTTFTCKTTAECRIDSDCGSTGSYCSYSGGKYYLSKQGCVNGKCVTTKEEVKCCNGQDGGPNSCPANYYCDYKEGCKPIISSVECPPGMCCKGPKYVERSCPTGLKCCPTNDPYLGMCKDTCETICNFNNKCEPDRGETPANCVDCQQTNYCNNNKICEPERGENEYNCNDCRKQINLNYLWAGLAGLLAFLILGKKDIEKKDWVGILIALIFGSIIFLLVSWVLDRLVTVLFGSLLVSILGGVALYFLGPFILAIVTIFVMIIKAIKG